MAIANFPVEIDISARDATSAGFSQTRDALRGFRSDVQASADALGSERDQLFARKGEIRENVVAERLFRNEFRQRNEVFFTSARAIGQVGNAFLKVNQIFINHNLLQQRQSELTERLAIARRRLNQAIIEEGAGSLEAQSAQATLNRLLNDQKNLAHETTIQYVSMSVAASSLAGDIANVVQTVGLLGFQLRNRGFTNLGSIFGRGAPRTAAIAASSAVPSGALATAGTVGATAAASRAGLISRFGLPAAVAFGSTLAAEQLGAKFGPLAEFFNIPAIINRALGGPSLSSLIGLGELPREQGLEPAETGGVNMSGSTVIIYTNNIADAQQLKNELETEARKQSVTK